MERLTYRTIKGEAMGNSSVADIGDILGKLADYEDLDEQGLLLKFPTEAYFIKDNKMYKGWVQEVVYSVCRKILLDIRYDDNSLDSYRGYVGDTVFLTKTEAEQKLKEMESDCMTIDEAIDQERRQVEIYKLEYESECTFYGTKFVDEHSGNFDCIKKMHEHEQFVDWLEELKELRTTSCG